MLFFGFNFHGRQQESLFIFGTSIAAKLLDTGQDVMGINIKKGLDSTFESKELPKWQL
jgi:hypothetical protein